MKEVLTLTQTKNTQVQNFCKNSVRQWQKHLIALQQRHTHSYSRDQMSLQFPKGWQDIDASEEQLQGSRLSFLIPISKWSHCACHGKQLSTVASKMWFSSLTYCMLIFFSPDRSSEYNLRCLLFIITMITAKALVGKFSQDFYFTNKYFLLLFEHCLQS